MHGISIRSLLERIATSLWLVPGGAAVLALLLAAWLIRVDRGRPADAGAWYLFGGEAASARDLLTAIASSLVTLTGLVFSITILVLQLASSQFSPRVMQTFLEDRTTRLSMGAFIGSFVYAMAVLPAVRAGRDEFVPALSVFVAFLLMIASVGVFVRYIHHMAHSIRAIHVVQRVARDTRRSLEVLYPESVAEEPEPPAPEPDGRPSRVIGNERSAGVLAAVSEDALLDLATRHDLVIGVVPFPGDFVPRGAPLLQVWGSADTPEGRDLLAHVELAPERTPHQDPAFGFRQLVDVAERALSPGVNDPTTAVQALDQIHDLLRALARRRFPSPMRVDETGQPRLVLPRPDWETFVRLGLDEIRRAGASSLQITRRLRAVIDDLLEVCPPHRAPPLREQLALLDQAIEREFADRADRRRAAAPSPQGQGQARSSAADQSATASRNAD